MRRATLYPRAQGRLAHDAGVCLPGCRRCAYEDAMQAAIDRAAWLGVDFELVAMGVM